MLSAPETKATRSGHQRRWRWGYERMVKLIEAGEIQLGEHNKKRKTCAINRVQPRKTDVPLKKLKAVWPHTSHNAGTHGSCAATTARS